MSELALFRTITDFAALGAIFELDIRNHVLMFTAIQAKLSLVKIFADRRSLEARHISPRHLAPFRIADFLDFGAEFAIGAVVGRMPISEIVLFDVEFLKVVIRRGRFAIGKDVSAVGAGFRFGERTDSDGIAPKPDFSLDVETELRDVIHGHVASLERDIAVNLGGHGREAILELASLDDHFGTKILDGDG